MELLLPGLSRVLFRAHPLRAGTDTARYEHRSTHPTASQQRRSNVPMMSRKLGCITSRGPLQAELSYDPTQ